jgi:serine/threonine protein phosphatase PrpC
MKLRISVGESSLTGPRPRNEDYVGLVTPADAQLEIKGALLAVADGISGGAGGAEAAEMTIRTVSADYYATPETWTIQHALDKVIQAANRWVLSQARKHSQMAGMATRCPCWYCVVSAMCWPMWVTLASTACASSRYNV